MAVFPDALTPASDRFDKWFDTADTSPLLLAHVAIPAFIGAFGLLLSAYFHHPVTALVALSLAALGIWGALGPFWALPTAFLSGRAAAGSYALINSVGNLGGFVGPYFIGILKDATNSFTPGLLFLSAVLLVGGILTLVVPHDRIITNS